MVLHAQRRDEDVRRAAEQVFYPFWDAGIPLGHAVRTVAESLAEASDRPDVVCSLLDARPVAGDPVLHAELDRKLRRSLAKNRAGWLERLATDAAARHGGAAACSTSLEPDLKEGSGGLRDIHAVGWTTAVAGESPLREEERERLDRAEEFLVRLRSALHLLTGKRSDRLFREHQSDLAAALGFDAAGGLDPAHALMRGLFEHARHVEHIRSLVMQRVRDRSDPSGMSGGVSSPVTPADVLETLAGLARSRTAPSASWLDALESADLGERPFAWAEGMRSSFVELLASGHEGITALEVLDRAGLLAAYLPEWEPVRCRPQRDPYHRYTVDVHLMATVAVMVDLLAGRRGDDQTAAAAATVRDREALFLGAFLHDIGKVGEGRHVEVGERQAAAVLERMAVTGTTREAVLFLVREHLLLSDTATRRDLSDPNLVLDVAGMVGDPERLAMLYLLSVADAEATGPHAATPWRMGLVRELVAKVDDVLQRREMDVERAGDLEARLARVRDALASEAPAAVDGYLRRLPRPYVLAVPPEEVAAHFVVLSSPVGTSEVRTVAKEGSRSGTWELTIVAADRPGLLARMAGSIALAGLSILSAQAFTTEDGVAIDLFVVEPAFHGEIDEERWRAVRHTLRKALEGRLSLEYRVREKRRHYPRLAADVPTEVRVLNDVSGFATVVEVEAADRLGLLFDLARTFEELHLDVSLAKVATYGPRVIDAFYVRDLFGQKIEDPEHADEIRRAILSRLTD